MWHFATALVAEKLISFNKWAIFKLCYQRLFINIIAKTTEGPFEIQNGGRLILFLMIS